MSPQLSLLGASRTAAAIASSPLILDYFAGGGGVSEGIRLALGRAPDVAINHCREAVRMHRINHPDSLHLNVDVWDVDPVRDLPAGAVGLFWASPDCTHFSHARGGKPVDKKIRGLAWIILRVAAKRRPAVIAMENVREFLTWGPLNRRHKPIKSKAGKTFQRFLFQLRGLGYVIEYRILDAADFGAPTHRRRLILVARLDGMPIVWPAPTHGAGRPQPYRTAAQCIDWSLPVPSIFERRKPLVPATQRRIAEGLRRFVFECARPFVVRESAPYLVQTGQGEREGQTPRVRDLHRPYPTIVAGGVKQGLVAAWLAKHNGKTTGQPLDTPCHTIVGKPNKALALAHLTKFHGTSKGGTSVDAPHPTITAGGGRGGGHSALVAAFITKYFGVGCGHPVDSPLSTITAKARHGLVTVEIDGETYALVDIGMRMLTPRELARCQGFPDSYELIGNQGEQIARIGNSVCPQLAEAVVRAIFNDGHSVTKGAA